MRETEDHVWGETNGTVMRHAAFATFPVWAVAPAGTGGGWEKEEFCLNEERGKTVFFECKAARGKKESQTLSAPREEDSLQPQGGEKWMRENEREREKEREIEREKKKEKESKKKRENERKE